MTRSTYGLSTESTSADDRGIDWRHAGVCRDEDPELFFPPTEEPSVAGNAQVALAKDVCESCPVKDACLAWALDTEQAFGVWGGKSSLERRALLGLRPLKSRHSHAAKTRA